MGPQPGEHNELTVQWDAKDLSALRRGDPEVFRLLIEDYSPRLLAMTRSFALDIDDAHDLLQDTWIRVYRKRSAFSGHGALLGWLLSVCRNVCLDAIAKRTSRARLDDRSANIGMAGFGSAADAETNRNELRRSIDDALCQLPPRERDVVVMRILDGCSVRETAQRMQCAEGTVKASLHHALKKLKASMKVWTR